MLVISFMCVSVLAACVYVYCVEADAHGGQKRTFSPLRLAGVVGDYEHQAGAGN